MNRKFLFPFIATFTSIGWLSRKSPSYGERHTYHDSGLQVWTMIPGISIAIFPPIYLGYYLAELHDKLIYMIWPTYYQKRIDDFVEKERTEAVERELDRQKNGWGSGSGNPQITLF